MTAGDGFGRRPQPPLALLSLGIELLPTTGDDLDADLVEQLLLALVDKDSRLLALRAVLSAALEHAHTLHVENSRLRRRLADLYASARNRVILDRVSTANHGHLLTAASCA